MKDIWLISDTHFNHADILTFSDKVGKPVRDFSSVDTMNQCMMDNWAKVVKPNDIVYHLGDVLFGHNKVDWMQANFDKLPGKKHLVLGNHDNPKLMTSILDASEHNSILSKIPINSDKIFEHKLK